MTAPSDPPKLFGILMEYDSVVGYWLDFGPIGVRLTQDRDDTWSWWVGDSTGVSGLQSRAQALRQIEKALLWLRSSIPESFP